MGGGILLNIYNTLHLVKKGGKIWQKINLIEIDIKNYFLNFVKLPTFPILIF